MRPDYRHNDITVLIIGNPNTIEVSFLPSPSMRSTSPLLHYDVLTRRISYPPLPRVPLGIPRARLWSSVFDDMIVSIDRRSMP